MRTTLLQVAQSRIPQVLGLCDGDLARLATYINEAQQILINVAGEDGFWGGWAKVVFNVTRTDPYITLPSEFARMILHDVCRTPIKIQNEWYEFLEAGIGLQKPCQNGCQLTQTYERGSVPTAYDLTSTNQKLRVYLTNTRDVGKNIIFAGAKDQNGNGIYSDDVANQIVGAKLTLNTPFVTTAYVVTSFAGIAKDQTYGDVVVKQVDATTGEESLLVRLRPWEMTPSYRRYYLGGLPNWCCATPNMEPVQVTAMCKYEFIPVTQPTDFLLIGNIPALKQQCQSIRHAEVDDPTSKALAIAEHKEAVKLLNQELVHYMGESRPAINVAPWGTAHLHRQRIGTLI